jgi:hypothetical protein
MLYVFLLESRGRLASVGVVLNCVVYDTLRNT